MYLVETRASYPVLRAWKYPLPGDSDVAMLLRIIIRIVRLQMPPDYYFAWSGTSPPKATSCPWLKGTAL